MKRREVAWGGVGGCHSSGSYVSLSVLAEEGEGRVSVESTRGRQERRRRRRRKEGKETTKEGSNEAKHQRKRERERERGRRAKANGRAVGWMCRFSFATFVFDVEKSKGREKL